MIIITINSIAKPAEMAELMADIHEQAKTGVIVLPPICTVREFCEKKVKVTQSPERDRKTESPCAAEMLFRIGYKPEPLERNSAGNCTRARWVKESGNHKYEIEIYYGSPKARWPWHFSWMDI